MFREYYGRTGNEVGGAGGGGNEEEGNSGNYDDYVGDVEEEEEFMPWIPWYCEFKGNEFFCQVDRDFIKDEFNLTGLAGMVPFYQYALDLILDIDSSESDQLTEEQHRIVESSAETLYGLIHARFITTYHGLKLMEEKYTHCEFGRCPRVFCNAQPVLPVGQSDVIRESTVKLFCPKCEDIYVPRSARHKSMDGAYWGTTFPHLLQLQMREKAAAAAGGGAGGVPVPKSTPTYIPRIYGFRIYRPDQDASTSNNNNNNTQDSRSGTTTVASHNNAPLTHTSLEANNNNNNNNKVPSFSSSAAPGGGGGDVSRNANDKK